ncbi:MAG: acyltransferase [Acidiphilium sp. 37-67-22]|nr:MAG: acyltransferase [Acidiphilium sp. 37-67-22]
MAYLDGLRGLAALQVVFLHYVSAFLPVIAMAGTGPAALMAAHGWQAALGRSPAIFLINGYSAVYIFFLLSGYVLRHAFARIDSVAVGVWRRLVRLGLPASVAVLYAGAVLAMDYHAHVQAAAISGSTNWLGVLMATPPTPVPVLRDAVLNSVLTGYSGANGFPFLRHLIPMPDLLHAFDPPTWTLNVELSGSVLCLGLSFVERRRRALLPYVIAALALWLGASQWFLFAFGYAMAGRREMGRREMGQPEIGQREIGPGRLRAAGAVVALIAGILLCRLTPTAPVLLLHALLRHQHPPDPFHFSNQIGAILIFLGVLNLPRAQALLERRLPQFLGRISFSLYLVHFPVMATLGCGVFITLAPRFGAVAGCLGALAVGLAATLPIAVLFERHVDRLAVRLSRRSPAFLAPATDIAG